MTAGRSVVMVALGLALAASPAPGSESDASKAWKELEAQEQWVARLQKQIAGETQQLAEMRASLAKKFKLDPKRLEAGRYDYDEKKDRFVENKSAVAD
jgi:hypothetical protein